jgi:hypothetical protein
MPKVPIQSFAAMILFLLLLFPSNLVSARWRTRALETRVFSFPPKVSWEVIEDVTHRILAAGGTIQQDCYPEKFVLTPRSHVSKVIHAAAPRSNYHVEGRF